MDGNSYSVFWINESMLSRSRSSKTFSDHHIPIRRLTVCLKVIFLEAVFFLCLFSFSSEQFKHFTFVSSAPRRPQVNPLGVCAKHFKQKCFANLGRYRAKMALKLRLERGALPIIRDIPAIQTIGLWSYYTTAYKKQQLTASGAIGKRVVDKGDGACHVRSTPRSKT